jgi:hypothetical protein
LAHSFHLFIPSSLAWLPRLELRPQVRGNSMCRTLSRCWISSPSPSSSATSLDWSPDDVYTPYVCNPSEVLHLWHSSLSTCMTTRPWGWLRLSSPTMFVREHSRALRSSMMKTVAALRRIDHGGKGLYDFFVFCFKPQQKFHLKSWFIY